MSMSPHFFLCSNSERELRRGLGEGDEGGRKEAEKRGGRREGKGGEGGGFGDRVMWHN